MTSLQPRRDSSSITARGSGRSPGSTIISAPRASSTLRRASSREVVSSNIAPPPSNSRASSGVRSCESRITRSGCRQRSVIYSCCGDVKLSGRTVSAALSASTVSMPLIIAQLCARKRCTSARACGPVIHWLSPDAIAVRPSRLIADFMVSHGRPPSIRRLKPRFNARASASSSPQSTAMPASRNIASPRPATCGFGSCMATTTRATPDLIRASAQGGVRP